MISYGEVMMSRGSGKEKLTPIIELMSEHALRSLLPRGTKTWQNSDNETTIDLILVLEELATSAVKCTIHTTEHRSDHRAIETTFDIATPKLICKEIVACGTCSRERKSYGLRKVR